MKGLLYAILMFVLVYMPPAFAFGSSSTSATLIFGGFFISLGPSDQSLSTVSKTSLFGDLYSASRVSGYNIFEIISRKPLKQKNEIEIRKYLIDQYNLVGDDLDKATDLMQKVDNTVVNWINLIHEVTNDDVHAGAMAIAADEIRIEQLKFEATLLEEKDSPNRAKLYRNAIESFGIRVNHSLGKGVKQ